LSAGSPAKLSAALITTLKVVSLLLLVVGLGFFLAFAINRLGTTELSNSQRDSALRLTSAILSVGIVLVIGLLLYRLFRGAWNLRGLLGSTPLTRLVGLAFTTLVFRSAVISVILAPWRFLRALTFDLLMVLNGPLGGSSGIGSVSAPTFANDLSQLLGATFSRLVATISDQVSDFPWIDLILALGTWAGVALLLAPRSSPGAPPISRFSEWWGRLSVDQRHRYSLGAMLLVAAYLSIAAIVAVPWLIVTPDATAITKERLEARLLEGALNEAVLARELAIDTTTANDPLRAPFDHTGELQADFVRALGGRDTAAWISAFAQFRGDIGKADNNRKEFLAKLAETQQSILDRQKNLLSGVLADFESNASTQMTQGERTQYVQSLERWFRKEVGELQAYAIRLRGVLSERDTELLSRMGERESEFEYARLQLRARARDTSVPMPTPESSLRQVSFSTHGTGVLGFLTLPSAQLRPDPPDPGSQWGPFRWVAQWLLRTRTLALVQITGMLGFGLFGAAIAGLGGPPKTADDPTTPVRDLGFVIVFGLASTLVVFLSVKGGLAAIGQAAGEPNSYVLFAACFVGAVYSDRVWKWAQEHILP
jgi:hypothetical protein